MSASKQKFKERLLVNSTSIISWLDGYERQGHFLKRTISVDYFGLHLELDERCVRSVVDKFVMDQANAVVTPGSKETSTAAATSGAKQLDTYSHRDCRPLAGLCQLSEMCYDTACATKEVMRDASNPTGVFKKVNRIARYVKGRPRCVLCFRWSTQKVRVRHAQLQAEYGRWENTP